MRIKKTISKNFEFYYIIKDINRNGKRTTKIVEKLGKIDDIKKRANNQDPMVWLTNYVNDLTIKEKEGTREIIKSYSPTKIIVKDVRNSFNGGYLFLQKIYYDLKINNICQNITDRYQFKYDLNSILSNLLYSRIIYPSSKLKTLEFSKNYLEQSNFQYNDILRSLEVIATEFDFIQSELYKNSSKYLKRNNKVLYYDCTNFFFEIEEDDEFRKYGKSKENRPNPIVQMGLFMDGDGIPIALDITPGNTNEQTTLKPLEEKIIHDFNTSKFVVCTDAGLASTTNRKFNNTNDRRFITTQSIKQLKGFLKEWVLDLTSGWKLYGSDKTYNISKLRDDDELIKKYYNKTFYKERWIKENDLEQRLIITYSPKYQEYQKKIRSNQINRALKLIESNPTKLGKGKQNDPKRFITTISTTTNGEVAEENHYELNNEIIMNETQYDGLYAVCTNLEDCIEDIIKINHNRWEIEESFRIMKSEFKSRPVFLSREDRIKAHFITCFLALVIFRCLEKKLDNKYTVEDIIQTLKQMNFYKKDDDYIPTYNRTDITDLLHEKFNFRTDYEILSDKNIKKIFTLTKK